MKLTSEQLKQFDEEGYLFFPEYFSPEETKILKSSVPEVFAQRRPRTSARSPATSCAPPSRSTPIIRCSRR